MMIRAGGICNNDNKIICMKKQEISSNGQFLGDGPPPPTP